jgi:hypothetical protein
MVLTLELAAKRQKNPLVKKIFKLKTTQPLSAKIILN